VAGVRTIAERETPYMLVTVWPSIHHRDNNGWALRVSTHAATVVDPQSRNLHYLPVLPVDTQISDSLSTAPQSLTFSIPWTSDTLAPTDVDFRYAVGEVAILWTSSGATGTWVDREVRVSGRAIMTSWGNGQRDDVTFTIQEPTIIDTGELWDDDAELSVSQFADMANAGEGTRAHLSAGLLPPRVFAPVGSSMLAPIYPIQDIVAADSGTGTNLGYMRFGVGARRRANTAQNPAVNHQFRMRHPTRTGGWMAIATSADYRDQVNIATDATGKTYYYVEDTFAETVGSSSFTFTGATPGPATATVTATNYSDKIAVGDQIKGTTGGNDDYLEVLDIDGNTITLSAVYGGPTLTNGEADVIRRCTEEAYAGYEVCTYGGESDRSGTGALANIIDVLVNILRDARLNVPIALGDLEALKSRTIGVDLSTVINERVHPWDWANGGPFSWFPIRPYREQGRIRFAWVGTVPEAEIETTINLDNLGAAYRSQPYYWKSQQIFPTVNLSYWWDIKQQTHTKDILQDGGRDRRGPNIPTDGWLATGRTVQAYHDWQSTLSCQERPPRLDVEVSELEIRLAAGIASSWILYGVGHWRQGMRLDIGKPLFWMKPGTIARISETGGTMPSQIWRVEQRIISPSGVGSLVLESVPD